jgi:hypothetical protein
MKINLGSGELYLFDNQPIRLVKAAGSTVHCRAGHLWITVAGVAGDTHLRSGESYRIPGNGLALIESIGEGRMCLEIPGQAPRTGRQPEKRHASLLLAGIERLFWLKRTA